MRDIGKIIREIPEDVKKECEDEIKEKLFAWAWPHIRRMVTRSFLSITRISCCGGSSNMNIKSHPTEIALALLTRSICAVQVAAVLVDSWGVFSWGWNSMGPDGLGEHAEAHAIRRANRKRLEGATIYVASQRKRNKRMVTGKPCEACQPLLRGIGVVYRDADGNWEVL